MYNTKALRQATRRIQACAKERKPNLAIRWVFFLVFFLFPFQSGLMSIPSSFPHAFSSFRTLADLANQGIQPDRIAATAVIDACVQSSKMDLAEVRRTGEVVHSEWKVLTDFYIYLPPPFFYVAERFQWVVWSRWFHGTRRSDLCRVD